MKKGEFVWPKEVDVSFKIIKEKYQKHLHLPCQILMSCFKMIAMHRMLVLVRCQEERPVT